jgi:hypothetical protein
MVSELYHMKGAKKPKNPYRKTRVHPLATSAKNEAKTTELKDALIDFLNQMGQRDQDYLRKLVLMGGDGLTYEKLVQLKRYLQFHNDAFQSLELLIPILELRHLEWTDRSRIYKTHWGSYHSLGFRTGNPWVCFSHTVPIPAVPVPVTTRHLRRFVRYSKSKYSF